VNISRWSRNNSQPAPNPSQVMAPPVNGNGVPWQPVQLPQREQRPPEPDPFVSTGAFAFADGDGLDDTVSVRAAAAFATPAQTTNGNGHAAGDGIAEDMTVPLATAAAPTHPSAPDTAGRPVLAPTYDHRMADFPAEVAPTAQAPQVVRPVTAAPIPTAMSNGHAAMPRGQAPMNAAQVLATAQPAAVRQPSGPQGPRPAPVAPRPAPAAPSPAAPALSAAPTPSAASSAPAKSEDGGWKVNTGLAIVQPRSANEVLQNLASKVSEGTVDQYQPVPLGFTPLDKTIGGGLRAGELLLIGGAQGTGKTTMAVQMARNIVLGGQASVLYICFEHDEEYLLNRIIAMESILSQLPAKNAGVKLQDVRREILGTWLAQGGENADLSANPRLKPALERINRYGQNLFLMRGSQTTSTVENMRMLVERYKEMSGDRRLVVFVDYMQKVPVIPDSPTEVEKVTYIVQGLKDVALANHVPMISIVAADKDGLKAARLRNHHLRGSSAINYEADIILILNEKYNIVAKVNIEFNPYQAQRFREWVICSIEKNRGGQNMVDLEFQKHFEFSCFDANGRTVQEKLIEERLYND
jgi:replicative DNA helicase